MDIDSKDKTVVRKRNSSEVVTSNDTTVFKNVQRTKQRNTNIPLQKTDEKTVVRTKSSDNAVSKVIPNASSNDRVATASRSQKTSAKTPRILQKRFQLQKVLGVGGMGVVYKAVDLRKVEAKDRNPFVAIKVLNEEFKKHPDSLIALQREARKSQSIAHPNIVNVHDFDRDGDMVFMTMEYLDGQPLDKVLKQYQYIGLPMNEAWIVLRGICEALIYAHQENIVHSDFKPGNIFLTSKGIAKVFDFGISRAVNRSDVKSDMSGEKTLFDAGTLGALTPAYASLEMLNGGEPDERDDIYALGCVAYEIFSGEHPYGKLPADKAYAKKLKPKRLDELTSTQWSTLQKALSFNRKDRISTVEEFYDLMFTEKASNLKVFSAIGLSLAIAVSSFFYFQFNSGSDLGVQQGITQSEINSYKDDVENLLEQPVFSSIQWHDDLWQAFKILWKVIPESDDWAYEAETQSIKLYVDEINKLIQSSKIDEADILLAEASKYNDALGLLKGIKSNIQNIRRDKRLNEIASIKKEQDAQRRSFERQKANLRSNILSEQRLNAAETKRKYNQTLNIVSKELLCRNGMNARSLGKSLRQLNSIDSGRYNKQLSGFVSSTIACINKVSVDDHAQAKKLKSYASQFFPGNKKISDLVIGYVDLCKPSFAGKAGKNSRAVCHDPLSGGATGPKMVVVRSQIDNSVYAISKYEISYRDYKDYCVSTGECQVSNGVLDLPVNNISIEDANSYIKWLSDKSNQEYSLPSYNQWINAAEANNSSIDTNRNCSMNSRGIIKGRSLVKVTLGKQNNWGLVNTVGNVQEWVLKGASRDLYAAGGSRLDEFSKCNLTSLKKDSGEGKKNTGFRVVRKII